MMADEKRFCAYCLGSKCGCHYRAGKRGTFSMTVRNTTAQSTFGEMKENLMEIFGTMSDDQLGMWSISFTKLDGDGLDKAIAKAEGATK